jgi:hypothetical protein
MAFKPSLLWVDPFPRWRRDRMFVGFFRQARTYRAGRGASVDSFRFRDDTKTGGELVVVSRSENRTVTPLGFEM